LPLFWFGFLTIYAKGVQKKWALQNPVFFGILVAAYRQAFFLMLPIKAVSCEIRPLMIFKRALQYIQDTLSR
jgi:hypothetical protein